MSPPVFETGYRAAGSPSRSGPGRLRTRNPPLERRELWAGSALERTLGRAAPLRPRPKRGVDAVGDYLPGQAALVVCLLRPKPNDVFHATRLAFDPGSPIGVCARPSRSASSVEGFWSPRLACFWKKSKLKHTLLLKRPFCRQHRATFSLRRGLDSVQILFKLGITLVFVVLLSIREQKRTTRRVALVWLSMRPATSPHTLQRGLRRHPTRVSRRDSVGMAPPNRRKPFWPNVCAC